MSRTPRKPSPRIAGQALHTMSAAVGLPGVDIVLTTILRKQLGVDSLLEASFAEDEAPFALPRSLAAIDRPATGAGAGPAPGRRAASRRKPR